MDKHHLFSTNQCSAFNLPETIVGHHEQPIRCVEYCPDVNVIVTGSWDSTVKLWDPRAPCSAGSFSQPDKVCRRSYLKAMYNTTVWKSVNYINKVQVANSLWPREPTLLLYSIQAQVIR